jgi:integrase-like protein
MDRPEDVAPVRGQPWLLDQVRNVIRRLHYTIRTEQTYVDWIRRFILFHRKRHPAEMGVPEVEAFLTQLAVQGKVAASTQNQALNAIVFLYRQRHQDGARAFRPQGRVDHDDLHPCHEPGRARSAQPAGRRRGLARLLRYCRPGASRPA